MSTKMDKTIVVRIARRISHPLYKKIITRYKSFQAHDERNEAPVSYTHLTLPTICSV